MNTNPETADLREVVQQTVEMVQQNARDNAYLRGAFEQMNQRFDNLVQSIDQRFDSLAQSIDHRFDSVNHRFEQVDKHFEQMEGRFEQVDKRFEQLERRFEAIEVRVSSVEGQLNTQLRWIIGLMAPIYLALIALVVKVFLGS